MSQAPDVAQGPVRSAAFRPCGPGRGAGRPRGLDKDGHLTFPAAGLAAAGVLSSQDHWEKSGGRYAHSVARRRGWAMSDVTCLAVLALALYPGQRPPAASGASLFVTRQVF